MDKTRDFFLFLHIKSICRFFSFFYLVFIFLFFLRQLTVNTKVILHLTRNLLVNKKIWILLFSFIFIIKKSFLFSEKNYLQKIEKILLFSFKKIYSKCVDFCYSTSCADFPSRLNSPYRQRHPLYLEKQKVTIENNNINKKILFFFISFFLFSFIIKKVYHQKIHQKICNWQIPAQIAAKVSKRMECIVKEESRAQRAKDLQSK